MPDDRLVATSRRCQESSPRTSARLGQDQRLGELAHPDREVRWIRQLNDTAKWELPNGLTVVLAQPADTDAILTIWEDANEWTRRRGIEPGAPPVPLRDAISNRITCGTSYIARRSGPLGEIVGTITLEWADDGLWSDRRTDDACYVHGLAVQRASAGQGIGVALLRWAEQRARRTGKTYVRLDCDANNPTLRAYYERAGMTHCGDLNTASHFACRFEKQIQS